MNTLETTALETLQQAYTHQAKENQKNPCRVNAIRLYALNATICMLRWLHRLDVVLRRAGGYAFYAGVAILLVLAFFLFVSRPANAATFKCVNCSTSLIQAIEQSQSLKQLGEMYKQVSEAVKQTEQQIQLVQTTFQQYQNMLQNTAQLPQSMISGLKGNLTQLAEMTSQLKSQRGDLTSMGQMFNELFPGQEMFEGHAAAKTPEAIAQANQEYQEHWDKWSAKVDESTRATFQLSGAQLDAMVQDAPKFQSYLDSLLATPDGQMKALMAGNQLSALQIQESRQLRELLATKAQSDIASQEKAEKEDQLSREVWKKITNVDDWDVGIHKAKKLPMPGAR